MVMRNRDHGMAIATVPAEIYGVISGNRNRRITIARSTAGHGMDCPSKAVIAGGDHRRISTAAILVGDISCAIGSNFDVPVQAAAIDQAVNRHRRTIGESAVQADGAGSDNYILRAVINGVLVSHRRRQPRNHTGCERTAADCLMIYSGRNSAADCTRVTCAVIVSEGRKTARTGKLRYKRAARGGVSEHNGIKRQE